MPNGIQVADALWHCLCPSFRRSATQWLQRPSLVRLSPGPRRCGPVRSNVTAVSRPETAPTPKVVLSRRKAAPYGAYNHLSAAAQECAASLGVPSELNPTYDPKPVRAALAGVETSAVHQLLEQAAQDAEYDWAHFLVPYLVHDRGERPDARHYAALIVANASPELGSAREVEALVVDMHADGVTLTEAVYVAIIKVHARSPLRLSHNCNC